jgi:hypothetical protein
LQIWADSPLLRTTLARDKVVDDEGRTSIERRLLVLVDSLREDLLTRLEQLAATGESAMDDPADTRVDPRWTPERHAIYGALHAHLELEHEQLGRAPRTRAILRDLVHARSVSLDAAIAQMGARPLLVAPPPVKKQDGDASEPTPIADGIARFLRALRPTRLPVLAGDLVEDRAWMTALSNLAEVELLPIERALARVVPHEGEATGLCGLVESLLRGVGFELVTIRVGELLDVLGRPEQSPVFGPEVVGATEPLAFHGGRTIPVASVQRGTVWLNTHNLLVASAIKCFAVRPLVAGLALTFALFGWLDDSSIEPDINDIAKLAEELERESRGEAR